MQSLQRLPSLSHQVGEKGWDVSVEARTGGNHVDLRLLHKRRQADMIELKSSEKEEDMENDPSKALEL